MALSANTVWELRTDAADTNGGGFVSDAAGQDYSQQAAPQASGVNLTVSSSVNTDVTPDGYTPVAADVGNLLRIASGTGFTVKPYQIVSIQSGKWRLDASPAATSTAGGVWALGGAMKSPALVLRSTLGIVDGNIVWIRGGSTPRSTPFDITANAVGVAGGKSSITGIRMAVKGYGTIRGDRQRPVIRNAVNTTGFPVALGSGGILQDVEFHGNKANFTSTAGLSVTLTMINCEIHDWSTVGVSTGSMIVGCFAHHNGTSGFTSGQFMNCTSYNNGSSGFRDGVSINCIARGNGNCGWINTSGQFGAMNCVAYGNTNSGFQCLTTPTQGNNFFMNCISYGNTTYGWGLGDYQNVLINCAYGGNTLANLQNVLTEFNSLAITVDPFINAANGNFNLDLSKSVSRYLVGGGFGSIGDPQAIQTFRDIGAIQSFSDIYNEAQARFNPIFRTSH